MYFYDFDFLKNHLNILNLLYENNTKRILIILFFIIIDIQEIFIFHILKVIFIVFKELFLGHIPPTGLSYPALIEEEEHSLNATSYTLAG